MTDWPVPDPSALVTSALARLGVAHRVMECDPAAADTAVFCERYGIAPQDSANTILVAIKREYAANPAHRALYDDRFETFVDIYRQMRGVYKKLNDGREAMSAARAVTRSDSDDAGAARVAPRPR